MTYPSPYAIPGLCEPLNREDLTMPEILAMVCDFMKVPECAVMSKSRRPATVAARHTAAYLMRIGTKGSLHTIGEFMGFDHTSVLNAKRATEARMDTEPDLKQTIETLKIKLRIK